MLYVADGSRDRHGSVSEPAPASDRGALHPLSPREAVRVVGRSTFLVVAHPDAADSADASGAGAAEFVNSSVARVAARLVTDTAGWVDGVLHATEDHVSFVPRSGAAVVREMGAHKYRLYLGGTAAAGVRACAAAADGSTHHVCRNGRPAAMRVAGHCTAARATGERRGSATAGGGAERNGCGRKHTAPVVFAAARAPDLWRAA